MDQRYRVIPASDLTEDQKIEAFIPAYTEDYCWVVVDTSDGRVVGHDSAEPEDKLLVRDFRWVVDELNRLDEEKRT